MQQGGTIENIITDVSVIKTNNTFSNVANSVFNAPLVGNIYNTPAIKNSVAFGDMIGYEDAQGNKLVPYKFVKFWISFNTNCIKIPYAFIKS